MEFCLLVEAGPLERQAVALAKSIRNFAGHYSGSVITAVSPRPNRRPSSKTATALEDLNVHYLEFNLESPVPEYGPSFKVLALAEIAQRAGPPILIQIDSDTLFCAEPELSLDGCTAAARPVDVKGMCSSGRDDPLEILWHQLASIADISLAHFPNVETTLGGRRVRASYNGGLLVVRRQSGLYQLTADLFRQIIDADIRPNRGNSTPIVSGAGLMIGRACEFWGTTQVAFSLAVAKLGQTVCILSPEHNIPLHLKVAVPSRPRHLHYHAVFRLPADSRTAAARTIERCSADFRQWLSVELPI